jgi:hypothetical protein
VTVPEGEVVQTVVVVTGAVTGTVVVPAAPLLLVAVCPVVLVAGATVLGTVAVLVVTGFALAALKPTRTPEAIPAPTKIVWVSRRTRAKRRSRCRGVLVGGLMVISFPPKSPIAV